MVKAPTSLKGPAAQPSNGSSCKDVERDVGRTGTGATNADGLDEWQFLPMDHPCGGR